MADRGTPEAVATALLNALLRISRESTAAIWLYGGSVFDRPSVDIDLHVLLRRRLPDADWQLVKETHGRLARQFCLDEDDLDVWYISLREAFGAANPTHLAPWTRNLRDEHWPLHRAHWLAGRCKVIYGLAPEAVVRPPSWEELESVLHRELQAPELEPSAYWVLQLCRVWASLTTGDVVRSKIDSAEWALNHLPAEHHNLVFAAVRWYERRAAPDDQSLVRRHFPELVAEIRGRLAQPSA